MTKRLLIAIGAALSAVACGGDDEGDGTAACISVAEAFARAWDRCDIMTYDEARALFVDELGCNQDPGSPNGVGACVDDIDALTCNAINATPSSCQSVFSN